MFSSGGKGWKVETLPEIKDGNTCNDEIIKHSPKSCYIASYHSCTKAQTIDLIQDYGISRKILHNEKYQFEIDVREWHIMKGPCRYELIITFRDEDNMTIQKVESDSKYAKEFEKGVWGKCHLTMTVCGVRKLRYITFYHGATCNQPVPTVDNNNQGNNIKILPVFRRGGDSFTGGGRGVGCTFEGNSPTLLKYFHLDIVTAAVDEWEDVSTKMTGGSISLSYPTLTQMSKDKQLYTNRYTSHPRFNRGKAMRTVKFIGSLENRKRALVDFLSP